MDQRATQSKDATSRRSFLRTGLAVGAATINGLVFPDLNAAPFGGEDFQTNVIMPEPTVFLDRKFPVCSIIRPTETQGAAMGTLQFLTKTGLFVGQSSAFFAFMT